MRLEGKLNIEALELSLSEVIRRHEILRTTFRSQVPHVVQVISPYHPATLSIVDLQDLPEMDREFEGRRVAIQEASRPFDLGKGPLMRTTLLRVGPEKHVLLLTMHHIISDGWSLGILIREVAALYEAFCSGQPSPLSELPVQYADFAYWQRRWLQGDALEKQLAYWRSHLKGAPAFLDLPTDRPRPPRQTYRGARHLFVLPLPLSRSLKSLSHAEGVTLFMTLFAAFNTLLYRYSNQADIVVGADIANRNRIEIERLIGFFVNMMVLRTDLSGNPTFRELLRRVRSVSLGGYAHQDVPFEKLVEELQPERDLSRNPLFQVVFVLQNTPMPPLELAGLTLSLMDIDRRAVQFDMVLAIEDTPLGLSGSLSYNTDLFNSSTITRLMKQFQELLEAVANNVEVRIADVRLLKDEQSGAFAASGLSDVVLSQKDLENLILEFNENQSAV